MSAPRTFSLKYPGWFEKRQDVRRKLDRINNGIWESEEEQLDYLRTVFGAVGEDLYFLEPVSFVNGKNIFIGDHVFIGPNVGIYTVNHALLPDQRNAGIMRSLPIAIGNNVWIGGHTVVMQGVTIGDNTVIGAGSVVTHDIPAGVVAVGSPCRVLRKITEADRVTPV